MHLRVCWLWFKKIQNASGGVGRTCCLTCTRWTARGKQNWQVCCVVISANSETLHCCMAAIASLLASRLIADSALHYERPFSVHLIGLCAGNKIGTTKRGIVSQILCLLHIQQHLRAFVSICYACRQQDWHHKARHLASIRQQGRIYVCFLVL
jgi:hypothetical protein